ncbi:hypothetical protein K435DRAFT_859239 [Dendrothele bispora CBS 962.96]|uniref:Uncharacterized protein n=1 Tax=Dendrothele bispora (strain CBS 962.96) TaxID=1314807 RepID=A0A4S8M1E1_DENBC|nr:hypothetical protein K435DRAFT_859239 [Dendrothele bispora CBS 962.96]
MTIMVQLQAPALRLARISPAALVPSVDSVPLASLFQLLRLRSKSTLSINTKLLCSQFESLVKPFVKRTVKPCKKALSDAGAKANTINDIILVSGGLYLGLSLYGDFVFRDWLLDSPQASDVNKLPTMDFVFRMQPRYSPHADTLRFFVYASDLLGVDFHWELPVPITPWDLKDKNNETAPFRMLAGTIGSVFHERRKSADDQNAQDVVVSPASGMPTVLDSYGLLFIDVKFLSSSSCSTA